MQCGEASSSGGPAKQQGKSENPVQTSWEGSGDDARGSYRGWNTDASESEYCIGCTRTCKELSKHLSPGTHIIAWKLDES